MAKKKTHSAGSCLRVSPLVPADFPGSYSYVSPPAQGVDVLDNCTSATLGPPGAASALSPRTWGCIVSLGCLQDRKPNGWRQVLVNAQTFHTTAWKNAEESA